MTNQTCWMFPTQTLFTRLLAAALVLILLTGCIGVKPLPESAVDNDRNAEHIAPKDISEIDQKLFERMANLFDTFSQNADNIWTDGYRFDQMPILLVYKDADDQVQHGYLFNHPSATTLPTAQLVEMEQGVPLTSVYRLTELPSERIKQVRHFDFQAPIAGVPTFVMAYRDPSIDSFSAPVSGDWDAFIVHEALHDYQFAAWAEGMGMQNVDDYPLDGDAIAAIQLEHKLLIAALSAADDNARDMALKQFVAVRSDRMAQNRLVLSMDNEQERFEGTARYIEHRLAQYLPNPEQTSAEKYLGFALALDAGRDELAFGRFYSTGAALSLLLDQVDIPWKSAVEGGQSQYDVLSKHYGLAGNSAEKAVLLEAARETYEYTAMQQRGATTAETVDDNYMSFGPSDGGPSDGGPSDGGPSDGPSDDGFQLPDGAVIIEPIQKPYEPVNVSPLTDSLPDEYTLLGGFEASHDELADKIFQLEYSPGKSNVSIVDYDSNGERLRFTKSRFDGAIGDVEAMEAELGFFLGRQRSAIRDVEVLILSNDAPPFGPYASIGFAHDGYWYSVAGPISAEQMTKIAAEVISK